MHVKKPVSRSIMNNFKKDKAYVCSVVLCRFWGVQGVIAFCKSFPSLKTECLIVIFLDL